MTASRQASPDGSFHTTLKIPPLAILPSPNLTGMVRLQLEGFGTLPRPGAPAVPVRIERIGIPEEGEPALRILRVKSRMIPDLRPEPVPSAAGSQQVAEPQAVTAAEPAPRRPVHRPDSAVYGRDADYPSQPLALGAVGWMRDQKYVELIVTPVQVNPVTGIGRITEEIEIEVSFGAATGSRRSIDSGKGRDRKLEEFYRAGLLNYEQAVSYRRPASSDSVLPPSPESTGGPIYNISVHQDGIYRVSCASAPSCAVPALLGQNPNTFRLRDKGLEVPMRVIGGADDSFDLGDALEFYGQAQREPFTIVNCSAPENPVCAPPIYEYNDTTDVNVYLLDATASTARLRMATLDGTPGGLTVQPDFVDTAHAETNDVFMPLNDHDPFYWLPVLTADASNSASRDISIPLPGISGSAFTASVTARLRGVSFNEAVNPDHRTRITLNAVPATTTTQDWDGELVFDHVTSASQSILTNPSTLHLEVPAVPTVPLDQVVADYVEISYRRLFQAVSDRLAFAFPNQAAKFSVSGFSGAPVLVYDLSRVLSGTTDTVEPRLVANGSMGPGTITFQVPLEGSPTGATRRFLVVGPGGTLSPDSVNLQAPNNLLDTTNEADYLIVAHPSLIDPGPGSAYTQFVSYLQNVRGLKTRLVLIGEIYDAFNNSIEHPEAIRSFLAYAHANWSGAAGTSAPPSYVLFVGDAVWDFKNTLSRADWIDLVPTPIMFYNQAVLRYHAADNWLASFLGGDQTADILYGRIPVRTVAQANTVFSKILAYAQSPPAGAWRSDGYFVADVGNTSQETQTFELLADANAAHFEAPWTRTKQYYAEPPYNAPTGGNGPVAQFKADFIDHWNTAHPALAMFIGHGAFDILGNDVFFRPADVPSLTNGAFQPFFYNSDCLSGGFHAVGIDSIAEAFLKSGSGGAVAYLAPAGISFTLTGTVVSEQLFGDLFAEQKIRELGTLTHRARDVLFQLGAIVDMQAYAYLGDPALSLVLPAPAPPTSFAAAAGNAKVDLSWSASADPSAAGTQIYRALAPDQPYTKVNPAPVTGTFFSDTTVANGTTYFYRAVSVDSGGFEGAVTNTNADCGATPSSDGPECRRATPQNLTPPVAPQGVKARDMGTGSTLEISWTGNPEPDIQKYLVAFGTVPGSYPTVRDAGLATSFILAGLTNGVPYYVVVRGVNTSGIQSAPSAEVSGAPHVFLGIAPPRTIQDLTIVRNGNDLVLSWGAVTTNIYGNPTVVDHYSVYRGNTPTFVPSDALNRIAVVPASPSPGYTHSGGATTPDAGFYLVSASDSDGFSSGLGGDLPSGIPNLQVAPSPNAGMIRLSWTPVTTTVTGKPTSIDHYTVYGSNSVLPRRSIGPASLLIDGVTGSFVDVPDPAGARYYYNVIAVDPRGNLSPF
ncbi:MAG TPA: C25 family cysteine peptidase [Candidatus Polarisedimenticolia bacterium]|nr:C25 family cysteine peptidase [Candidatus Polarisedimenticolia bacterium]